MDYKHMERYTYAGPVTQFGKVIANNWKGETMATNPKRARTNLAYQFKTESNMYPSAQIVLTGKIKKEVHYGS